MVGNGAGSKDKTCWMRNKASPSREKLSEKVPKALFLTDVGDRRQAAQYAPALRNIQRRIRIMQGGNTMEPTIYRKQFTLYGNDCDCFGRVKPSTILSMLQEAAGEQCNGWHMSWEEMAEKGLFWAMQRKSSFPSASKAMVALG